MLLLVLFEGTIVVTFMPTNKTGFKLPPPFFLSFSLSFFFLSLSHVEMCHLVAKGLEVVKKKKIKILVAAFAIAITPRCPFDVQRLLASVQRRTTSVVVHKLPSDYHPMSCVLRFVVLPFRPTFV
jgi:hypothetical protein